MNVKCAHRKRKPQWGGCKGKGIPQLFPGGELGREESCPKVSRPPVRKVYILETKEEGGVSGVRSQIKITQTCSP